MKKTGFKLQWLLLGSFLGSIGNSFVWPLTTIYIHDQLHQSLTVSGVVLLFYSGANVVGSYIAGLLFDRKNPRHLMIGGLILAMISMAVLIFSNGWPIYPVMLTIIGFFNGWIITMVNSFGTRVRSHDGRFVFNMLYFANNLGMVLGTTIVGPLYQLAHNSVSPLFAITVVMYAFFLLVVVMFFQITPIKPRQHHTVDVDFGPHQGKLPAANAQIIWTLFISFAIIWIMYGQWSSNMSVYMTDMGISMTLYSMLWTINGILIVLFQAVISWLTKKITNDYYFVYFGILTCGLSFVLLLFAKSYGMFVLAMVVLTLGEATAFPTIPAIINLLSPVNDKGKYQGMLNAFASTGKAIGPLFGGLIIERFSYRPLFVICAVSILVVEAVVIAVVMARQHATEQF